VPLRCETALDQASPTITRETPTTRLCRIAAGSRRGGKNTLVMKSITLGADMAHRTFTAALWFDAGRVLKREFANGPAGFRALSRWLQQHGTGPLRIGIESTSVYGEALAGWMHQAGHQVHLLNPERTACYARVLGQRNKTDPADAVTIARFVAAHEDLMVWHPLPPAQKDLRSLTRVRSQLVHLLTQLTQQLHTASGPGRAALLAAQQALKTQLLELIQQIRAHLQAHSTLGAQVRRLMTCKGVGLLTAATVVAELPPITPDTDPRALCSWAGLTPRRRQSGAFELPARLGRSGNAYLRSALYMPALVAKRWNPTLRAFALRLKANGKSTPAILGALSHKMLRILVAMLRSCSDFNPLYAAKKS
jgi:transposase